MSLQASTYLEGDSDRLRSWLTGALDSIKREFPEILSFNVDLVDVDEVSVTLKLSSNSFGEAETVAHHVIERVAAVGVAMREERFQTGQTELLPA